MSMAMRHDRCAACHCARILQLWQLNRSMFRPPIVYVWTCFFLITLE
jgi:hypothetical protein